MPTETQAVCGFSVTTCAAIASFVASWMPLLQLIAVALSIATGALTLVLLATKLWNIFRTK